MSAFFTRLFARAATYSEPLLERSKNVDCACAQQRLGYFGTKLGCTPNRFEIAKSQFSTVVSNVRSGNFTTKEFLIGGAIFLELVGFFYVGEVVGRGSVIGYNVPSDKPKDSHH